MFAALHLGPAAKTSTLLELELSSQLIETLFGHLSGSSHYAAAAGWTVTAVKHGQTLEGIGKSA